MHKWLMAGLVFLACVVGAGLILFGLPPREEDGKKPEGPAFEVPDRPVDEAAAQAVYKANCLACHGDRLQGGMGPALDRIGTAMSKEMIYERILTGGNGMPPFEGRLTEEELVNLTNWLAAMGT